MSSKKRYLCKQTKCLNNILETNKIPEEWKTSKTVMIPKTAKPKVNELRPLAITNISYKLFMSTAIKNKIEEHIVENGEVKETQSGFTNKGRIENNLFVLKYCKDKSYEMKTPLVVIAVDFSKAYDSVKRGKMIEVLKSYNINSELIDIVSKVYVGDSTNNK